MKHNTEERGQAIEKIREIDGALKTLESAEKRIIKLRREVTASVNKRLRITAVFTGMTMGVIIGAYISIMTLEGGWVLLGEMIGFLLLVILSAFLYLQWLNSEASLKVLRGIMKISDEMVKELESKRKKEKKSDGQIK